MHVRDVARLGDEECLRHTLDVIICGRPAAQIRAVGVGDVELGDVGQGLWLGVYIVHPDEHHPLVAIPPPYPLQHRGLFAAGRAPTGPEVDHHHLAPVVGQGDGLAVEGGQGEIGGRTLIQRPLSLADHAVGQQSQQGHSDSHSHDGEDRQTPTGWLGRDGRVFSDR